MSLNELSITSDTKANFNLRMNDLTVHSGIIFKPLLGTTGQVLQLNGANVPTWVNYAGASSSSLIHVGVNLGSPTINSQTESYLVGWSAYTTPEPLLEVTNAHVKIFDDGFYFITLIINAVFGREAAKLRFELVEPGVSSTFGDLSISGSLVDDENFGSSCSLSVARFIKGNSLLRIVGSLYQGSSPLQFFPNRCAMTIVRY